MVVDALAYIDFEQGDPYGGLKDEVGQHGGGAHARTLAPTREARADRRYDRGGDEDVHAGRLPRGHP
jgi:hypothetical protein